MTWPGKHFVRKIQSLENELTCGQRVIISISFPLIFLFALKSIGIAFCLFLYSITAFWLWRERDHLTYQQLIYDELSEISSTISTLKYEVCSIQHTLNAIAENQLVTNEDPQEPWWQFHGAQSEEEYWEQQLAEKEALREKALRQHAKKLAKKHSISNQLQN